MIAKLAVKTYTTGALFVWSVTLAAAPIQHRHHVYAHHIYAQRHAAYRASQPSRNMRSEAIWRDQAYGVGYGGVPENPLIPIKPEVPPPVDPNEPASGSYGAMLEGRNPAPSEP